MMKSLQGPLLELDDHIASIASALDTLERTQRMLSTSVAQCYQNHNDLRMESKLLTTVQVLDDLLYYTVKDLKERNKQINQLLKQIFESSENNQSK